MLPAYSMRQIGVRGTYTSGPNRNHCGLRPFPPWRLCLDKLRLSRSFAGGASRYSLMISSPHLSCQQRFWKRWAYARWRYFLLRLLVGSSASSLLPGTLLITGYAMMGDLALLLRRNR